MKDDSLLPDINDVYPYGYVLKVLNSLDSTANNLIDAQNEMMIFLGIFLTQFINLININF